MSNYSEHVDRRVLNGLLKKYTKDDDLYQDLKILPPDGHSAVLEILENTPNQRMSIADISTIIAQYNRANEYPKITVKSFSDYINEINRDKKPTLLEPLTDTFEIDEKHTSLDELLNPIKYSQPLEVLPEQQSSEDLFKDTKRFLPESDAMDQTTSEALPEQQPSSALFDLPSEDLFKPSEQEEVRSDPYEEGTVGGVEDLPPDFDKGGRVRSFIQHLQTGGEALNADTTMEVANVPMGIVSDTDGAPAPFNGGTGVEDDLEMEVDSGSYVLNAEAVQLVGISDINEVIRDAYSIAVALGKQVPEDYDPQNKVPIRISNGEAVIPKVLVEIIGLDKLEKWNNKGLEIRKQQEEEPQPQEPQIATEAPPIQSSELQAPMQQQMGQLMNEGGEISPEKKNIYDDITTKRLETIFSSGAPINKNTEVRNLSDIREYPPEKTNWMIAKHRGATPSSKFMDAFNKVSSDLYGKLIGAEWRNSGELENNDLYRFTGKDSPNSQGKFSSAFGPIQITTTRARDLLKLVDPKDKDFKSYVNKFIKQGDKRISQLQYLNSSKRKQMGKKKLPIPKPDIEFLGKGVGNISKEDHDKYYEKLSILHLDDLSKQYDSR